MAGQVFISYSRRDDAVMRRIVAFLRGEGINVWLDNEKLVPGTPIWETEIEKALRNSSAVVVILSPDSTDSEWVRREITLADQFRTRIFPVLIRGDEDSSISIRLVTRQFVDLRHDETIGLKTLSAALSQYLRGSESQKSNTVVEKLEREVDTNMPSQKPAADTKTPFPLTKWGRAIFGGVMGVAIAYIMHLGGEADLEIAIPLLMATCILGSLTIQLNTISIVLLVLFYIAAGYFGLEEGEFLGFLGYGALFGFPASGIISNVFFKKRAK